MENNLPSPLDADVAALQQIFFQLNMASHHRMRRELEVYELTLPQYSALRAIRNHPQGACSMSELAEASFQVSATMTGIVDRLVENGLVERRRDPHDRRALLVSLTPEGARRITEIEGKQRQRLLKVFERLAPEERGQIIHLMEGYLERILADES